VSLDGRSTWVVNKTSYLTALWLAKGAQVVAPKGHRLSATVDGKDTALGAGDYQGAIVLKVEKR
jgi:hypothetical protein